MTSGEPGGPGVTDQRPVPPVTPIVATVAWLLLGLPSGVLAPFSFFLFDAGDVSDWTWLVFWGLWLTPLLCLVSILASWPVWALTRRRRRGWARTLRIGVLLLPLLGLALIASGWAGIDLLCAGDLTCR